MSKLILELLYYIVKTKKYGSFVFIMNPGTHTYTIRTSTMYAWYEGDVDAISVSSILDSKLNNVYLSEADVLREEK